jgi:hypothetical protein
MNPINNVTFLVELDSIDSTMISFDGVPAVDSLGNDLFLSGEVIRSIFGPNIDTQNFGLTLKYTDLLDFTIIFSAAFSAASAWDEYPVDSVLFDFGVNRSLPLSGMELGMALSYQWNNFSIPLAKQQLDPVVPVIEGDDLDYSSDLPAGTNKVLDLLDYKTNQEEIDAVVNHQIYTFNQADFISEYANFTEWVKNTKNLMSKTVTYDQFLIWLDEYLSQVAINKMSNIDTPEWSFAQLTSLGNHSYKIDIEEEYYLEIFDNNGRRVYTGKNATKIDLSTMSKGIYFIRFTALNNSKMIKLIR